jgi:hypothetical protein
MTPITLILDGNNFAHLLYDIPSGQKVTAAHDERLISQLAVYVDTHPHSQFDVLLCMDWFDSQAEQAVFRPNLRISLPGSGQKADDDILGHVLYLKRTKQDFTVVTADQDLQDRVTGAGGTYVNLHDFVLLAHPEHPVFCPPENILPLRVKSRGRRRRLPADPAATSWPEELNTTAAASLASRPAKKPATRRHQPQPESAAAEDNPSLIAEESIRAAEEQAPAMDEPRYRLSLEGWPVQAGVRFLTQSFCKQHCAEQKERIDALSGPSATYNDLLALAELLAATCADEPGFASQGSLMDRVRLALLRAPQHTLPLSALISQTGVNPSGLRRRLKEKAGDWIEII